MFADLITSIKALVARLIADNTDLKSQLAAALDAEAKAKADLEALKADLEAATAIGGFAASGN
jgi:hypothetical protein